MPPAFDPLSLGWRDRFDSDNDINHAKGMLGCVFMCVLRILNERLASRERKHGRDKVSKFTKNKTWICWILLIFCITGEQREMAAFNLDVISFDNKKIHVYSRCQRWISMVSKSVRHQQKSAYNVQSWILIENKENKQI